MSIDWFTFVAQVVNFLVLVALLHRFLYGPIVRAMEQREQQIADRLKDADRKKNEADEQSQQYADMSRELEEQREELLHEARREAQNERERLGSEARHDVQKKRDEWLEGLHREQHELLNDFRTQSAELSVAIARRTLQQLANAELEEQILNDLLLRIQELDDPRRTEIAGHLADGEGEVLVTSTFEISDEGRSRLEEMIRTTFEHNDPIVFETSADLVCGVELDVGGYTFGWNVKEMLRDISFEMTDQLKSRT